MLFCPFSQSKHIERGLYNQAIMSRLEKYHCNPESDPQLGMHDVYTLFVFMATSIIASLLCCCVEKVSNMATNKLVKRPFLY
jgi:hypothetical protein